MPLAAPPTPPCLSPALSGSFQRRSRLPQSGFPPASFTCSGPTGSAVAREREREGGGQVRSHQVHPGNCPGPERVALRRSVWVQSPLALPFVEGGGVQRGGMAVATPELNLSIQFLYNPDENLQMEHGR
ncbi:hypothetical protein QTO34_011485 [Cnephaeus nilssonii]|uniref:Uncharacterized protein n=1 Tax=Cnephaeus nilssonii TaxID=3371016 RepID=A0AA40HDM3_CNENI|nr:hypothetical protein QTO34_011485 [Eptesicus nilssonii]